METIKGFTLIELLLYIAISAAVILSVSFSLSLFMQSRAKNQTIAEIDQQGLAVMQIITQTVRNGTAITSPAVGASESSLTVTVPTGALNPTIFDLSSGVLRITEGAGSAVALTNSKVTASGLTFRNLSITATPGIVQITFTLTYTNPSGRNEYDYNKTFIDSVNIRR